MSKLRWSEIIEEYSEITEEQLYFLFQIEKGWEKKLKRLLERHPKKREIYWNRLLEEVRVILKMNFPGYFLITQDFLLWADSQKIRRGFGRGSVGGSLIAFLMDITKIDPIKYNLLFSRFLNADRVSMPDIDNDIETDRRDEIKQYLRQKYGEDKVASISTFGTMKVRACIKDIIRSLNLGGGKTEAFRIANQVNKLMPNDPEISFEEACNQSPEFKALVWYPNEEELKNGWDYKIKSGEKPSRFWQVGYHLRKLEGIIRQSGTHAAGVVISPIPLSQILPIAVDKNDVVVTANSGKMVEDVGFLKIDLLGLNTLSIIQKCVENIKKTRNLELKSIPLVGAPFVVNESNEDFEKRMKNYPSHVVQASRAYRLCRSGQTEGIFQCESQVAKKLLQDLQVNSIEDLSAVLALNRPGPLKAGLASEFGDRKSGAVPIPKVHPVVDKILEKTYGGIIYQENCMQLAIECAGFTASAADSLRKCMGKKLTEQMAEMEKKFLEGCYQRHPDLAKQVEYEVLIERENGTVERKKQKGTIAEDLFNRISFFSSYGFNSAHSVAYAHNTYYTAFLKANYLAEFWAAQLSYESDQVKINRMIMEAKRNNIEVLPVSVNTSSLGYEAELPTQIRRSLGTLKSVGNVAIEELRLNRPYKSIIDFLLKCDMHKINRKTLHALICAGAFDEFGIPRKTLDEKIQECKRQLERWCKRKLTLYIKFAGARVSCLSTPVELDLERLADPTSGDEEKFLKVDPKFRRIHKISQQLLEYWKKIKPTIIPEKGKNLEEVQLKTLKMIVGKWQRKANQILRENEWDYNFIQTESDKEEWPLEILIIREKEVYGSAVSAHIFDRYLEYENKVQEKFPTSHFTFDQSLDELGEGMEVIIMCEVIGLSKQFPYSKDPTKFVRLFRLEDRFGSIEITVFDKSYDEFVENDKQIPVRTIAAGNILIIKAKVNFYANRKSLVYEKCLKIISFGS